MSQHDPRGVGRLVNVLRTSVSIAERLQAIDDLVALGKDASGALGALIESLESKHPTVSAKAHHALRELAHHGVKVVSALKLTIEASSQTETARPHTAYALEHIEAEMRSPR